MLRLLIFLGLLIPTLGYSQQTKVKKPLPEKKNAHLPYACIFEDGAYPATVIQRNTMTKDSTVFARIAVEIEGCLVIGIRFPKGSKFLQDTLQINDIDDLGNSIIQGKNGNYYVIQAKYEPF
ncbi:hypothetical protein EWU23_12470 [Cytophagaceae bacterium 50C-KIRBA]|uniref:Uncharacterized protein n=1 Tax=Aquirufa beregesia TaxID=2516556 RepID=A0ABX0F1A6_9BACT|nr:hypothetical protein [Aquirufa beregesia]NGZ45291.1 hypothetical protein [Aquirufa beregesia]